MSEPNEADAKLAKLAREALEELNLVLDWQLPPDLAKDKPNLRRLRRALIAEADNE